MLQFIFSIGIAYAEEHTASASMQAVHIGSCHSDEYIDVVSISPRLYHLQRSVGNIKSADLFTAHFTDSPGKTKYKVHRSDAAGTYQLNGRYITLVGSSSNGVLRLDFVAVDFLDGSRAFADTVVQIHSADELLSRESLSPLIDVGKFGTCTKAQVRPNSLFSIVLGFSKPEHLLPVRKDISKSISFTRKPWFRQEKHLEFSEVYAVEVDGTAGKELILFDAKSTSFAVFSVLGEQPEVMRLSEAPDKVLVADIEGNGRELLLLLYIAAGKILAFDPASLKVDLVGEFDRKVAWLDFLALNVDGDPGLELLAISSEPSRWFVWDWSEGVQFVQSEDWGSRDELGRGVFRPWVMDVDADGVQEVVFQHRKPMQDGSWGGVIGVLRKLDMRSFRPVFFDTQREIAPHASVANGIPLASELATSVLPLLGARGQLVLYSPLPALGAHAFFDTGNFQLVPRWKRILTADFDGDGWFDLLARPEFGRYWHLLRAPFRGSGQYERILEEWNPDTGWRGFVAADFNGDGLDDFAALDPTGEQWWLAEAESRDEPLTSTAGQTNSPQFSAPPCVGYNPAASRAWGELWQLCPPHYAVVACREGSGRAAKSPLGLTCCPLPAEDVLLDESRYTEESCAENEIVTGQHAEGSGEERVALLHCTKINEQRYELGEPQPGVYWGVGHSGRNEPRRIHWSRIPESLRYAVGRIDFGSWTTDGCLGVPAGSFLVAKGNDSCSEHRFRVLRKLGKANQSELIYTDSALGSPFIPH